ncbi:MAG: ABC transporter substrate-binding protein [Solirubrobacterales bacterium]|nr:ABC transporter substrate-binding protein [Solirubrobacterales bacterium]
MKRSPAALAVIVLSLLLAACGSEDTPTTSTAAPAAPAADTFAAVEAEAKGQTVRWWMFGGDEKINAYVDDVVAPAAEKRGVTIERVPITDTADAVGRVVSERRAGKTDGGGVDMIWINGENFAAGKKSDLWLEDWSTGLPNAMQFVDYTSPAINTDFQVPVDGQESPWQSARFVFATDSAKVPDPPQDFDALLAYAKANPGRFTYPAPPDFTGSAFVRQVVAAKGEGEAFAYLKELKPLMYRKGESFPKSQAELDELFANKQVDFAMAYDANFVNAGVRKGGFPGSARPFLIGEGALTNTSYVTIPANAANQAGAKVVADVLLDPEIQAEKAKPSVLGNPTVLDLEKLGPQKSLFVNEDTSEYVLTDYGTPVTEVAADEVATLEKRWMREILR